MSPSFHRILNLTCLFQQEDNTLTTCECLVGHCQSRMPTEAIITFVSLFVIKGVVSDLVMESFSKAFFFFYLDNIP